MSANILHMTHLLNGEKTFFFFSQLGRTSLCVCSTCPTVGVLKTGALVRIMCMNAGGRKKKQNKTLAAEATCGSVR